MISRVDALVKTAERAAVSAGRALVSRAGNGADAKPGTHEHDVVTAADSVAEAMITRDLTTAFPDSVVVGEESSGEASGEIRWHVDPIDGTHNFSRGIPLFCVSIGVEVHGSPAGGCVYDPVHDELFSAYGDRFLVNGRPAPPSPRHPRAMVLSDVPRPGVVPDASEIALFLDLLAMADVRRIGTSALALAHVACGRAGVAVTADAFVWDVAAGRTLVTAAGGGFVPVPGEPSAVRPGGFVAWGPGHEEAGRAVLAGLRRLPALAPEGRHFDIS